MKGDRIKIICGLMICMVILSCSQSKKIQPDIRPNIVLIVADDAGFSDFSSYGGEIPTPNIDGLASAGFQFTDFHVAPNCAPTRAALLSGMDNHLAGLGTMSELITENQKGKPGYEGYLNSKVISLPEILQAAGYHTYMTGKWHLGGKTRAMRPIGRGFQRSYAMLAGGASHWADNKPLIPGKESPYVYNGELIDKLPQDFYSSKNYTDSIISFIDTDIHKNKPFFAYLAFTAPHNPLHAPADYIEKYSQKYDSGWEALAANRLHKMKELGLVSENQSVFTYPDWLATWDSLTKEQRALRAKDMEVYAAMIDYMDMSIGRLINYLKSIEQYENTMIIFISDNGASKTTIMDYAGLGGEVADHLKSFDNSLKNKGLPNSAIDIGPAWAWASNTPFRLTKGYPTEGGMRVPCIIKMPSGFIAAPKQVTDFAYVSDLMPTILEVTNTGYPERNGDSDALPMQGISLLTALETGEGFIGERQFGFEIYGMRTYRSGYWKIVYLPEPYGSRTWQLYNLKNDLSEQVDLSGRYPEKRNELIAAYTQYAERNGVVEPSEAVGYAKPPKKNAY